MSGDEDDEVIEMECNLALWMDRQSSIDDSSGEEGQRMRTQRELDLEAALERIEREKEEKEREAQRLKEENERLQQLWDEELRERQMVEAKLIKLRDASEGVTEKLKDLTKKLEGEQNGEEEDDEMDFVSVDDFEEVEISVRLESVVGGLEKTVEEKVTRLGKLEESDKRKTELLKEMARKAREREMKKKEAEEKAKKMVVEQREEVPGTSKALMEELRNNRPSTTSSSARNEEVESVVSGATSSSTVMTIAGSTFSSALAEARGLRGLMGPPPRRRVSNATAISTNSSSSNQEEDEDDTSSVIIVDEVFGDQEEQEDVEVANCKEVEKTLKKTQFDVHFQAPVQIKVEPRDGMFIKVSKKRHTRDVTRRAIGIYCTCGIKFSSREKLEPHIRYWNGIFQKLKNHYGFDIDLAKQPPSGEGRTSSPCRRRTPGGCKKEEDKKKNLKLFECERCHERFTAFSILKFHLKKAHGVTDEEYPHQIGCRTCGAVFVTRSEHSVHVRTKHYNQPQPPESIPVVYLDAPNQGRGPPPVLQRHGFDHSQPAILGYRCICGFRLSTRDDLETHVRHARFMNKLTCKHCGQRFKSQILLHQHIRKEHRAVLEQKRKVKAPFSCTCGKGFYNQKMLDKHFKGHSHRKIYRCVECPKQFYQRNKLLLHRSKIHSQQAQAQQISRPISN